MKSKTNQKDLPGSILKACPIVSYVTTSGGVGCGRLLRTTVYKSAGNGWYTPVNVRAFVADDGRAYRAAIVDGYEVAFGRIINGKTN